MDRRRCGWGCWRYRRRVVNPCRRSRRKREISCQTAIPEHNPGLVRLDDQLLCFKAFLSSVDRTQISTESGSRYSRVLEWVLQHVGAREGEATIEGRSRPSRWFTNVALFAEGILPNDDGYHSRLATRHANPDGYERGHLAAKYLAERVSADAGWFTHTVANAYRSEHASIAAPGSRLSASPAHGRTTIARSGSFQDPCSSPELLQTGSSLITANPRRRSPSQTPSTRSFFGGTTMVRGPRWRLSSSRMIQM